MPGDTPFDAALAALDVEVSIHAHRQVTTYDILGLDAVRAAHRAEVERAVREAVEQEREACAAKCDDIARELDGNRDMGYAGSVCADAIRARGVAKPRTGSEAPSASDEGAKS